MRKRITLRLIRLIRIIRISSERRTAIPLLLLKYKGPIRIQKKCWSWDLKFCMRIENRKWRSVFYFRIEKFQTVWKIQAIEKNAFRCDLQTNRESYPKTVCTARCTASRRIRRAQARVKMTQKYTVKGKKGKNDYWKNLNHTIFKNSTFTCSPRRLVFWQKISRESAQPKRVKFTLKNFKGQNDPLTVVPG